MPVTTRKTKHNVENVNTTSNNNGNDSPTPSVPLPSSPAISHENSLSSKLLENVSQVDSVKKLHLAKAALHTATPLRLPSREKEIEQIQAWIQQKLENEVAGGMYISGSPGTGKTACVDYVLNILKRKSKFITVKINCMTIKSTPSYMFEEIAYQLGMKKHQEDDVVRKLVSEGSSMIVMVLDEVDQLLDSKLSSSQNILKAIFEWPKLLNSRLILIGIANALDLSTRHLPKYFTSSNVQQTKSPKSKRAKKNGKTEEGGFLMHFTPYQKEDITKILEDRLNGSNVFDPAAIKFVAMKVSATSGDIRKALNACKIALDKITDQGTPRKGLKVTSDDGFNPGASPKKQQRLAEQNGAISVLAVSKVFTCQRDEGTIPLQQGIILLTLHKINSNALNSKNCIEDGVQTPIPLDRIYKEHLLVCEKHMFPKIDRSDLPSACSMLQDRCLVTMIERGGSASPSSSSPRSRTGLKRGLSGKSASSGLTGILFDPRAVEIALRNDPVLTAKLEQ